MPSVGAWKEACRSVKRTLHVGEVGDGSAVAVDAHGGHVEAARFGLKAMALHERMRGTDDALLLLRVGHRQIASQVRAAPSPVFDFEEHHRVQLHENGIDFMTALSPVRGQKLP